MPSLLCDKSRRSVKRNIQTEVFGSFLFFLKGKVPEQSHHAEPLYASSCSLNNKRTYVKLNGRLELHKKMIGEVFLHKEDTISAGI